MDVFTTIIAVLCMLAYTIYAIWQISQFEKVLSGFIGTSAVIAGGIAIYMLVPLIASLVLGILKLIGIIVIVAIIFATFLN